VAVDKGNSMWLGVGLSKLFLGTKRNKFFLNKELLKIQKKWHWYIWC